MLKPGRSLRALRRPYRLTLAGLLTAVAPSRNAFAGSEQAERLKAKIPSPGTPFALWRSMSHCDAAIGDDVPSEWVCYRFIRVLRDHSARACLTQIYVRRRRRFSPQ